MIKENRWSWLLVSLVVIGLDQTSKYWVLAHYHLYYPHPSFSDGQYYFGL